MRPRLGRDAALRALLDAVVADCRGGVERVGDVLTGQSSTKPVSIACPTQSPAKQSACSSTRTCPPCAPVPRPALVERPGEVLDVVAVLVREDVRLGERPAARAQLRGQLVEEAEVDVDVLVVRAVERARPPTTQAPHPVWMLSVKKRVFVGS